ncbi:lipopolysaccharide biosynthesis protein [Salinispira pacifica]|uniref:Polysaccharide biosynthesis protein n=1 Tax=Salinispira pacifica TaxID=1307761 RepID=V5WMR9_9SPIO|nr:oligosaccharide flippase family protein [Salinispira pacifica]AHC16486.1 Polysaccharide biosynthesis protein [Salinispira pacifica]
MSDTGFSIKKVFAGASIYSLGEVLVKASGFFLIPIYTRVLTPADFGIVGYLQVILQIVTVVVGFGFNGAQTRYYYENKANIQNIGRFNFTINLIPIGFGLIVVLPLAILSSKYDWTIGSARIPFHPYLILTLGTVVLQVMANNAVAYYKAQQRFSITAVLQVFRFLLITGATLYLVLARDMGALGRVGGLFLGMAGFVLISFQGYAKNFVFKPSKSALIYAFSFGGPIVVHLLAANIHNALDRVILEKFVSIEELGIYTLGFTIGNAMAILVTAFNQAYQPSYFQLMSSSAEDKSEKTLKIFKIWLALITLIAVSGIVLGKPFISIFAGADFQRTIEIFPLIIISFFASSFYYFFSAPIFFFKKTVYLPLITGTSAVLNIILNFILIPIYGISGAAIATIISHVMQSVLAFFIGNRLYKVSWPLHWVVLSSMSVALAFIFTQLVSVS